MAAARLLWMENRRRLRMQRKGIGLSRSGNLRASISRPAKSRSTTSSAFSPINTALIQQAARLIRAGELVAFPTETVYGLGANALDPAAVAKIYQLKGRPETSPLIVHASSIEMARALVTEWPAEAQALAQKYWPGALTLVLPKAPSIPDIVTAGLWTVGVRVPAHPIALALIDHAGVPVA